MIDFKCVKKQALHRYCTVLFGLICTVALPACAMLQNQAHQNFEYVYFGTRVSDENTGIYGAKLDHKTGVLMPLGIVADIERPTWLEFVTDSSVFYATASGGENGTGLIYGLKSDPNTGAVSIINKISSGGEDPTFIAPDVKREKLYIANFRDSVVSEIAMNDDLSLQTVTGRQMQVGSGPHRRQDSAHAHAAVLDPSGQFVLSPDLGADKVFIYKLPENDGGLQAASRAEVTTPAGTGPRHLVFHPNGKFCYLVFELTAQVQVYSWNAQIGELIPIEIQNTLSEGFEGFKSVSELAISKDGRFLYVTNRGENHLIVYNVSEQTGAISEIQRVSVGGKLPWHFAMNKSEEWLLIANFKSNSVTAFRRDDETGLVERMSGEIEIPQVANVAFRK